MLKSLMIVITGGICAAGVAADNLSVVPVHDKPVWQQVQAVPSTQAQAPQAGYVEVKSMTTHQVLGWVPVGYKFLSFGSGNGIITMPLNGEIGYLPASVVGRVYASTTPPPKPPPGPVTLETLAEEYEIRVETGAGVSLQAESSIVSRVKERTDTMTAVGAVPGDIGVAGPMDGVNAGPNSIQPGAALATGGPQALGGMVGVPGK